MLSAKEVIEIITAAKKLGATLIRVDDIEVEFLQREPEAKEPSGSLKNADDSLCDECGEPKGDINRWGKLYCKPCYLSWKERKRR